MKIKITIRQKKPLYQKLTGKIKELKTLGITNVQISEKLKICEKTVRKGLHLSILKKI